MPASSGRLKALLFSYANLSADEADELSALYQAALPVERALLLSDEALTPNLDRFRAEHHRALRTPFRHYAILVATAVGGFATAAYAVLGG